MATTLTDYLKNRQYKGFKPVPYYCREGDFLTYFFMDEDHYAERVDDFLTLYHPMGGGDECVGFKIKGVRHLLKSLKQFDLFVSDNDGVRLGMLLLAGKSETDNPEAKVFYARAAERVKSVSLRHEALEMACA